MKKRIMAVFMAAAVILSITGCASSGGKAEKAAPGTAAADSGTVAEIQVFVANSLNDVIQELAQVYQQTHPGVKIIPNALGSQELRQQIESGMACDLFISANMAQMTKLDENTDRDYVRDGSIVRLLTNELVLISGKNSGTSVTGLETIPKCRGVFALAGEEVPAGSYSRQVFEKLDITDEVFSLDIDEKTKVGDVRSAVAEGLAEIGTVYRSDACKSIDRLDIIDTADASWLDTPIVYPMALIHNSGADAAEREAAEDFYEFLQSEEAAAVFEKYMFTMYR